VVIAELPTDDADEPAESTASVVLTPLLDLAGSRYAVSGLGVLALGSALGALEITKRPRRRLDGSLEPPLDLGEAGQD
jgi:hypothetical protein